MGYLFLLGLALIAYLVLVPILLAGARSRVRLLDEKVDRLQRVLDTLLASRAERETPVPHREAAVELGQSPVVSSPPEPSGAPGAPEEPVLPESRRGAAMEEPAPEAAPPAAYLSGDRGGWKSPSEPEGATPSTSPPTGPAQRIKAWLLGGNTVARVGVIILFFGVAFSLKYAADRGWLPTELRVAGAALGGMLLLVIGWFQRERNRHYGLVLQGGGVGIVYLTVFAAVHMFQLLPAGPGLVLMVVLVALASILAVLQDARSLAVLATVGGFLAPVLISRGGSHVQLFSYYAVLDAGILGIAWLKAWRELNLVGFVFTFVIGGAWGYRFYQPEFFGTTEPFLVLFFLLYLAVPVLFAERQPPRLKGYVDGTLVFGVPLVAFGLQSSLVHDFEYGLALSALAAGLFYAVLALGLRRRKPENTRLLTEAFLALAVAFGTLVIPLAVDGRWTGAAWSLEGAALVWVGLRQRRVLARTFGLLVQVAAGISFLTAVRLPSADIPLLNSLYLGALMVSVAGFFSAYQLYRHDEASSKDQAGLSTAVLVWGLVWWYGAGVAEIWRHLSFDDRLPALLGLVAVSSVVMSLVGRRLRWPDLGRSPLLLLPAMLLIALVQFLFHLVPHPLAHWGWVAWGTAFVAQYWLLRRHDADRSGDMPSGGWHSATLWLAVFLVAWEGWWIVGELLPQGPTWRYLVPGLVPALVILALPRLEGWLQWPLHAHRSAYFDRGLLPLVVVAGLWVLHASLQPGDPRPLSYLPLLNPLELVQCIALVAIFESVLRDWNWIGAQARWRGLVLLGFIALNGAIARAIHFLGAVPFDFEALWSSPRYQTTVSITWTLLALTVMVGGTRLRQRVVWISGAALLAAVVAKLFLVDLAGIGTLARILSFVVVGVLILVTGYLSPLPPRSEEQPQP